LEPETFPAKSVARTTTKLTPTVSEMLQEKLPPLKIAAAPLQVTEETLDSASDTVPETATAAFEKAVPSAGEETAMIG